MRKIQNDELARLTLHEFKHAEKLPFVILLDNVRSMHNIGSVFRTADAFRCTSLGLCGITAVPPHREIHKSALGAEDSVDWFYDESVTNAIQKLKSKGYTIIAIEQAEGAIPLQEMKFEKDKKFAFVFGHEIHGVSDDALSLCDACIEIPQLGTKHSLNISVSAGIVCWSFFTAYPG